jgi:hypothetical protein
MSGEEKLRETAGQVQSAKKRDLKPEVSRDASLHKRNLGDVGTRRRNKKKTFHLPIAATPSPSVLRCVVVMK